MSSTDTLEIIAPQYVGDSRAEDYLSLVALMFSSSAFGAQFELAMACYVAHRLTLADRELAAIAGGMSGVSAGPVTSRRAGDLALGYGSIASGSSGAADDEAALRSTVYGSWFLDIRNGLYVTAPGLAEPASETDDANA